MAKANYASNYRTGQRELDTWLRERGLQLIRTTDLGIQKDEDGWDHYAYTVEVTGTGMPYREESGKGHLRESYTFPYRMGLAHKNRPKLWELISSLLSDAGCVMHNDFPDFCRELGYDEDSRKAEKIYNQIQENNARLRKLFNVTDLGKLLDQAAPLLDAAGA